MATRTSPIPIFIISFNRLTVLKQSLESYRQIAGHTIVIHDTGSTYAPLLDYLVELEQQGAVIYRDRPAIKNGDDLTSVNETVQSWLEQHPDVNYYVVTDPDVMLEDGCGDILRFYEFMITTYGVPVVGPMLRIDDIPDCYPLRQRVIDGHSKQYWDRTPSQTVWNSSSVAYLPALIDTTFGMYRRGRAFTRPTAGARTYKPYWAKHLDWYINPANMADDQLLYLRSASKASHWGGYWLRNKLEHGVNPPEPTTSGPLAATWSPDEI